MEAGTIHSSSRAGWDRLLNWGCGSRLRANHHDRLIVGEGKSDLVPDVGIVRGDIGKADFRRADVIQIKGGWL